MALPLRDDGTAYCCRGFGGEHFAWCEVGAEIARLHRLVANRDALRDRTPRHPALASFDVLADACERRLAELDSGDRAWVAYSEACE